jgi:dihydrofolate reductase
MPRLAVFNNVTLDGYFSGPGGDLSWSHKGSEDPEWRSFVEGNASGGSRLLFGRITYDLMASYWPTPAAMKNSPDVAEGMNNMPKFVFSRSLDKVEWSHATLVKGDLVEEVRKMKDGSGEDLTILGSGSIVSQLAQAGLIDEYQLIVHPVVLGKGKTMFEGITKQPALKLIRTRAFNNGNVLLSYAATA